MKNILLIICILLCVACKKNEAFTCDRFNGFYPDEYYFDSSGGTQIVTTSDYILLDGVFLYENGGKSETVISVPSECSRKYPYLFETEWVTVNRTDATTLEITVPPRTDKIDLDVLVRGIDRNGINLSPDRIQIYQNYETE